jgi:hypothetical protein
VLAAARKCVHVTAVLTSGVKEDHPANVEACISEAWGQWLPWALVNGQVRIVEGKKEEGGDREQTEIREFIT